MPPRQLMGAKYVYTLLEGEDWRRYAGLGIVVTHPDRKPKIIHDDGREETISIFSLACDDCHGFGEVLEGPCSTCGGDGYKPEK